MATYDYSGGGSSKPAGHRRTGPYMIPFKLDFSSADVADGVQNDIYQCIDVPANHLVMGVHAEVLTANISALLADFDVGDGADVDGYHDGLDATAAVNVFSGADALTLVENTPNTILGYENGKYYSAADTIDIKIVGNYTVADGVIMLRVVMWDFTVFANMPSFIALPA